MSDRIVRPTFSGAGSRNASNAETALMVAVAFAMAALMIRGAYDLAEWAFDLLR